MGRIQAILGLQTFVIYYLCLQVFLIIQKVYRKLIGTDVIPHGKGRLCSIVYRRKRDVEEFARSNDFVTVHNQFIDVSLLDNPNWTIYSIEPDTVTFVQLPRHIKEYDAQRCPFMYVNLFDEAMSVVHLTIEEFIELADEMARRPQPETIFYTNTARCGSTLLAKMLHNEGYSQCYAESYALANLSVGLGENIFSEKDIRTLLPRVVTVLRSHLPSNIVCILKTESTGVRLVPYSDEVTQIKHIFSFRKGGITSVARMMAREHIGDLLNSFYITFPKMCNLLMGTLTGAEGELTRKLKPSTDYHRAALVYASPYGVYLKNQERFMMPCIWFKDLIHNTEDLLNELFTKIGIPLDCVPTACKWKEQDSQKDTFLAQDKLKHLIIRKMNDQEKEDMNVYASAIGVPRDTLDDS